MKSIENFITKSIANLIMKSILVAHSVVILISIAELIVVILSPSVFHNKQQTTYVAKIFEKILCR